MTDFISIDNLEFYDSMENKSYKNETTVFKSKNDLRKEIQNRIQSVCEITRFSEYSSCKLLIESKWCVDKALDLYYQNGCFYEDQLDMEINYDNVFFCDICMQNEHNMVKLSCEHKICNNCCKNYLNTKLIINRSSKTIECPYIDCNSMTCIKKVFIDLVSEKTIQEDPEILDDSFIFIDPHIKKCPKCQILIQVEILGNEGHEITCKYCWHNFCSLCFSDWHELINCELLNRYKRFTHIQNEYLHLTSKNINQEMFNWLKSKTKTCPNCNEVIEKNKGCNIMRCSKCKHLFCWECLIKCANHSHACDLGSKECLESKKKQEEFYALLEQNKVEVCKPEILKSLSSIKFNEDRYYFHTLQLEKELAELAHINLHRLKNLLKYCRNLLRHSYIFSVYLEKLDYGVLFEMQRMLLEVKTQELRDKLFKDESKLDFAELENFCKKLSKNIINMVNEGYENNYWVFKN